MKRVSILGATGSIGQNTIDLIRRSPADFDVVALTGARNITQLAADAIDLKTKFAVTAFDECYQELVDALAGSGVKAAAGQAAMVKQLKCRLTG